MRAAEVAPFCFSEETVPETDKTENEGDVDAFDQGEQAGVTSEVVLELMERAKTFFGFKNELRIALEGTETDGVMDVGNKYVVLAERLAQEHIFVTIMTETLIEGVGEHERTTDEEIGCVEVLIGRLSATGHGMMRLFGFFVEITEAAFKCIGIAIDGYTTYDDIGIGDREVSGYEVGRGDGHVAIDEEQMVVLGLLGKKVADGSPSAVLAADDVTAVLPLVDTAVGFGNIQVGGSIVSHENLIGNANSLRLVSELIHQGDTSVVVGGDEDGQRLNIVH